MPDDALERGGEGGHSTPAKARGDCRSEQCRWYAYEQFAEGVESLPVLAELTNQKYHADHPKAPSGPHDHHWAERALTFCSKAIAEVADNDGIDKRGVYIKRRTLLFGHQKRIAAKAETGNDLATASLAYSRAGDETEKIAAAQYVVTKREAQE
ncbi:MAG: hypothetical protein FJ313_02750, partial [Gemmatimonadetes bacterium]|nr:hypothetical protein [Gemmatimonadota bacterium]